MLTRYGNLIEQSYSSGEITGTYTGGLVGHNNYGLIKDSYSIADVKGTGSFNGGEIVTAEVTAGEVYTFQMPAGAATIVVQLEVVANTPPVAVNDYAEVMQNSNVLIDVLANDTDKDGDTLSITGFTQGSNGTVSQEGDSLRYTPNSDYNGIDSFEYDISDGNGGIATATVFIVVATHNINDGSVNITEHGTYTITGTGVATTNTITVAKDVNADITLNNVHIHVTLGYGNTCAFLITDNSTGDVSITLVGENILRSGESFAGLQKGGFGKNG